MLKRDERGFTMVELMVALTVAALLAAIAVPTMRGVVENSRIRATSQSIQSGLALARAEAVRLNTRVEFVLQASSWSVRRADDASVLHEAAGKETNSTGLLVTIAPAGADRVTFDAFGRQTTTNPSDNSAPLSQIDVAAENPSSSSRYRPLRVQLLAAGMSRLCDPAATSTEAKACL